MDPLRASMLRQYLENETAVAKEQAASYPEGSALYYYTQGRVSAFIVAAAFVDLCMMGPRPDPGTEDLPPGTP